MNTPDICPKYANLCTILDSLDALVYVSDMKSHEILYMNDYGHRLWGDSEGRKCWQVIQSGQFGPCQFCTSDKLLDAEGKPAGPYVWEFKNTANNRWYQCRDQAITWSDGRLARLEIATDITDGKQVEAEREQAVKRAEELAHTDELTGLNNRRAFFALGQQALRQAQRNAQPVSLVMLDADRFKQINDTYGHSVGDRVLRAIADTVQPLVRQSDVFGRIGGEEFAVLMIGAGMAAARQLAERLRAAIEQIHIELPQDCIDCTASFGIASAEGRERTLEKLLSAADHAMYQAKHSGRNRIVESDE